MIARVAALCAALALLAGAATATPPRLTSSDDRLVAGTQTHFYVLREIVDNLGSHYAGLHDQHLVEISLESGAATRFWPLRRMRVNTLATDDFLMPGQVTERPGETADMMRLLAKTGAAPLSPQVHATRDFSLREGALMRDGERVATPFAIRAAGRAQLAILRDAYPPITTQEAYHRGDRIDFYDLYNDGDWSCELRPDGQGLHRAAGRLTLVKLRCEDADLAGIWSFHMLIPDPN